MCSIWKYLNEWNCKTLMTLMYILPDSINFPLQKKIMWVFTSFVKVQNISQVHFIFPKSLNKSYIYTSSVEMANKRLVNVSVGRQNQYQQRIQWHFSTLILGYQVNSCFLGINSSDGKYIPIHRFGDIITFFCKFFLDKHTQWCLNYEIKLSKKHYSYLSQGFKFS